MLRAAGAYGSEVERAKQKPQGFLGATSDDGVVKAWGGWVVPAGLGLFAAVYLVSVAAECLKTGSAGKKVGPVFGYFAQIAGLFPKAAAAGHDYRVEGFQCKDRRWVEVDVAPWFPIDSDNKENRFYRAVHFYRELEPHRPTMQALDEFIVSHYNEGVVAAASRGEGRERIGGVRFIKVKLPFGSPGDGSERYVKKPLDAYPSANKTDLFHTKESLRFSRCGIAPRPSEPAPSEGKVDEEGTSP